MLLKLSSVTEMDKSRDVRRGASRFSRQQISKQSGHKPFSGLGGDFVSAEKSKREKLRKLSVVGRASSSNQGREMGCDMPVSDKEDELPSQPQSILSNGNSQGLKLPQRYFDDCSRVDHASVPRKLRSAMKKRNRQSISPPLPDSKKANHTIDGVKSPKKKGDKAVSGPITKDEEEVVETLYALARMFPDSDMTDKSKLATSSEAKPSSLPEARESPATTVEGTKEDLDSTFPSGTAEAPILDDTQLSSKETIQVVSSSEPIVSEQPDLPNSKELMGSYGSMAQVNLTFVVPSLTKDEQTDQKSLCNSINFNGLPEPSLDDRPERSAPQDTALLQRRKETVFAATTVQSQLAQQHRVRESKKNGLALWPGLCSKMPQSDGSHGPPRSSAAKTSDWLDAGMWAPSPRPIQNDPSTIELSKVASDRRPMKRCSTHVYISHLIRALHMTDGKKSLPLTSNQVRPHHGSDQRVPMVVNDLNGVRDGLNCLVSDSSRGNSFAERNRNEVKTGVLQDPTTHENHSRIASDYGTQTSRKQNFDFLSLSTGAGGPEGQDGTIRTANGSESLSKLQLPCTHSIPQHHQVIPCTSQTRYTSSTYNDQLSAAVAAQQVQLQLPPYPGSRYSSPFPTSSLAYTRQQLQLQQLQHLQQRHWAALSAQYGSAGTSASLTQWQNGKHESPPLIPSSQGVTPSSSVEVFGPRYSPMSQQQQQQFLAIMSSSHPSKLKRQDHHLPSIYEESGGGFRAGSALPLQLLCNEHQ